MKRALAVLFLLFPLLLQAQQPDITWPDGSRYWGQAKGGAPHGQGRLEGPDGRTYEGGFADGRFHGKGRVVTAYRDVYEGEFVTGQLTGRGHFAGSDGAIYDGEFKQGRFDGQGRLRLPSGDEYQGAFAAGVYEGQGTLKYARRQSDGRTADTGIWRQGKLEGAGTGPQAPARPDPAARERAAENVELALYRQRPLLDAALAGLAPSERGRINLYLLAVGGDGSEEVFRREVEYVRAQFDRDFGTRNRSVALINSRSTVATVPMATQTSIRESLKAIAGRMDRENDILFLFLTSHGSRDHEFRLNQNAMTLRGLRPADLAQMLEEARIRWKAILVSACYAGGFIEPLKSESTLIITAARADRTSFGCADENEFTDFGRAYFKESLPRASSFQDAFAKASSLVQEWEVQQKVQNSLPQMVAPVAISEQLRRWWAQRNR